MTAPVLALGLAAIAAPLRRRAPRTGVAVVVGVPLLLMAVLTGIAPALVGGQQQRLALANAGVYYDRFWISDSEVQALSWLGAVDHADTTNARIIANRNIDVRLLGLSDNRAPVSDRLFPTLLTNDAYVFLDGQVVDKGTSTVFYTGDVLSYRYPTRDLDARLDLVYSAPHTRIYR
jgi:hypothetical protein